MLGKKLAKGDIICNGRDASAVEDAAAAAAATALVADDVAVEDDFRFAANTRWTLISMTFHKPKHLIVNFTNIYRKQIENFLTV